MLLNHSLPIELIEFSLFYQSIELTRRPSKNITSYFENRDVCGTDEWININQDVESDKVSDEPVATTLINNLKPATQYAIYVKANVLIGRSKTRGLAKTGISPIEYFRTKPSRPSKPEKMVLKQLNSSAIEANWQPPLSPNGEIKYYKVRIEKKVQKEIIVDNCEDKKVIQFKKKQKRDTNQEKSNAYQQCSKISSRDPDRIRRKIEIENELLNIVYPKSRSNILSNIGDTYIKDVESNELKIYLNSTKFKEQLKYLDKPLDEEQKKILEQLNSINNSRIFNLSLAEFKSFGFKLDNIKNLKMNITNLAKIGLNENEIAQFAWSESEQNLYEAYRKYFLHKIGQKYEPFGSGIRSKSGLFKREIDLSSLSTTAKNQNITKDIIKSTNLNEIESDNQSDCYEYTDKEIIVTTTSIKICGLEYYTEYSIQVSACQTSEELDENQRCSHSQTHSIFTQKVPGANVIRNLRVELEKNSEGSEIYIHWSEPEKPNGQIKYYKIEYNLLNTEDRQHQCVTRQTYLEIRGYSFTNLVSGDYQFRIIAVSTGDKGDWTEFYTFNVPEKFSQIQLIIAIIVVCIIILTTALIIIHFIDRFLIYNCYRKKAENLYASVNSGQTV